jgi:hypothetical protein
MRLPRPVAEHRRMTTHEAPSRITGTLSTRMRRGGTVLAAVAAALAIWAVAAPGLGVDLAVRQGATMTTVNAASVLMASLVAGLAAWGLTALLSRVTVRSRGIWLITAAISLLLSLAGPLAGGATVAATTALVLMHLVVGAILMFGLAPRIDRGTPYENAIDGSR